MNNTKTFTQHGEEFITAWNIPGGVFDKKPITSQSAITILDNEKKKIPEEKKIGSTSTNFCSGISKYTQESDYLKYIGGSNISSFRRIFWLLVVIGAMCGLFLQVYKSTSKFAGRGTNTKVSYVTVDELDFPSVTICNTNMFRLSHLSEYYGGWMGAFCHGMVYVRQLFPQPGISSSVANRAGFHVEEYPGDLSLYEFVVNSAHTVEDMIKFCQFNGRPCNFDNFTTTITNYGVCFTFNSVRNQQKISVKTPGKRQGLSLILDAGENEVVAAPRESIGFKMLVHPRGELPNLEDYGVELQPGTHTPVRLDVTRMLSLSAPYGKCGSQDLKYFGGIYTETKCYLECETDYIASKCGCRSFYMPGTADYCSPEQLRCFYREIVNFAENRGSLCSCPEQCFETKYNPTISQMAFPSVGVATTLYLGNDFDIIAMGFSEAVAASGGTDLDSLFMDMMMDIQLVVSMTTISNGSLLSDLYPITSSLLPDCFMMYIFGNVQYELYLTFTKYVFYDVMGSFKSYDNKAEHDGVNFTEEFNKHANKYLYSGVYRQCLEDSFIDSAEYSGDINSDKFQAFADNMYDGSNPNETFYELFTSIYEDTNALVLKHGTEVHHNFDVTEVATEYMRKNLVHVDVFYGDLKVEEIVEQPSYEVFQFICDLGGALGLFFGASILSFIETADYWFTARCCGSKKKSKISVEN